MPFIDDLERELHRVAVAREPEPRRRWSVPAALAPAAAVAALVVAVILSGALTPATDREEPAREGRWSEASRLAGSHVTTVRDGDWNGRWELFVRDRSARLLGVADGVSLSLSAGRMTFRGDEVTFRVDLAGSRNDPWPEPICARRRRDTPGRYRIVERPGGAFALRLLDDPCRGRAAILTAGVWRRPGADGS